MYSDEDYDWDFTLSDYQERARQTAIYPSEHSKTYPLLGLMGEVGEFANKYKKVIRDNKPFDPEDVISEIGDILWYVALLAYDFGFDLEYIAHKNIEKLSDRKDRGVIGGSGDNR